MTLRVDDLAPDVSPRSLAIRILPALILVGFGFALAYGWIGVRGMRSYPLGAGSSMQYRDGTEFVVDPVVRSARRTETSVHLTSGSADFAVVGAGRSSRYAKNFRGDDTVIVYTPAARIVTARPVGASFTVTAEPNRTTVACRTCGKDVHVFSRAEIEYVPHDDETIVVPLMFLVR